MAESAVMAAFAAALLDPERPVPSGVTVRPGADPGRRLAVYRNNVTVGLIEALRAGFPVVERIVGEAFFRAMARTFVAGHKPSSPLLFAYGSGFPAFVAGFAPAASVPYLAGVAALEAARTEAWHAAEAPALGAAELAARLADRTGEALLAVRVMPHPAARLVTSPHPVASIWVANQGDGAASQFDGPWRPECALVTRPAAKVRTRSLDAAGGAFAAGLLAGASVGEAGATALDIDEDFDAGGALVGLAGSGMIADLEGTVR